MIPKKGTAAYNAVKRIQEETADAPEHQIKRRSKMVMEAPKTEYQEEHPRMAKGRRFRNIGGKTDLGGGVKDTTTGADVPMMPPPAPKTKLIDDPKKEIKKQPILKDPEEADVRHPPGVTKTGKTKGANAKEFITDDNLGPTAAVSAQLPDQKKLIKKSLSEGKKTPKIVTVGEGTEKTIEGMKTNDPAAIEAKAPFSFQALRFKIGA